MNTLKSLSKTLFVLLAAASLSVSGLRAAVLQWDTVPGDASVTDGGGTWTVGAANWYNQTTLAYDQVWADNNTAVFGAGGTAGTVTLGGNITAAGITFNAPGSGYYVFNNNTLTLASGANVTNNASGVTINSLIAGTSWNLYGSGVLSNTANNTFTGTLTVYGGTLSLKSGNSSSPAGRGTLQINSGATVTCWDHNQLGNESGANLTALFINGGTFYADQYNHANNITMNGGTLGVRSGISQVDGMDMRAYNSVNPTINSQANTSTATISSLIKFNAATTFNVADGAADPDLLVSGSIVGQTYNLVKTGAGSLRLTTVPSYTSPAIVAGGTLALGVSSVGNGGSGGLLPGKHGGGVQRRDAAGGHRRCHRLQRHRPA